MAAQLTATKGAFGAATVAMDRARQRPPCRCRSRRKISTVEVAVGQTVRSSFAPRASPSWNRRTRSSSATGDAAAGAGADNMRASNAMRSSRPIGFATWSAATEAHRLDGVGTGRHRRQYGDGGWIPPARGCGAAPRSRHPRHAQVKQHGISPPPHQPRKGRCRRRLLPPAS